MSRYCRRIRRRKYRKGNGRATWTDKETHGYTDRQTRTRIDRQRNKQTDTETHGQKKRHTHRQTKRRRYTDRQRDTWTGTINRRTDGQAIGQKDICDNEI